MKLEWVFQQRNPQIYVQVGFYLKLAIICYGSLLFQLICVNAMDMFYKTLNCYLGHGFARGVACLIKEGFEYMAIRLRWAANLLSPDGIPPKEWASPVQHREDK